MKDRDRAAKTKRSVTLDSQTTAVFKSPYTNPSANSSYVTAPDGTLGYPNTNPTNQISNQKFITIDTRSGYDEMGQKGSGDDSTAIEGPYDTIANLESAEPLLLAGPNEGTLQPQLSWTMSLSLLTAVTIVSPKRL